MTLSPVILSLLLRLSASSSRADSASRLPTLSALTRCGAATALQVLTVDPAWLTPDAVFDAAASRLHVVYGTADKNAYYVQSMAGGAFTAPIKLNTAGLGVTTTMGERGPKIALAANNRLVVVWADYWTGAGCRVYARSVYSTDNGATWSSPVSIAPSLFGVDGLSVAAGTYVDNQVVASFHVNTTESTNASSATWLHYALSLDGGATWAAPQVLSLDGGRTPAVACSMCMTRPRFDADTGELLIAYRGAVNNVRDFRVVRAAGAETNAWTTSVVDPLDHWVVTDCPMNGPELSLSVRNGAADAAQLVAYMTGDANNVFWSTLAPGSGAWSAGVPTPLSEPNERYPTAVAARSGDVVMVWNVGPMAASGDAAVKWACYASGNATAAQTGVLGCSFAGTKATALALGDEGGLLIITTAA